jgi:hypothetical protein
MFRSLEIEWCSSSQSVEAKSQQRLQTVCVSFHTINMFHSTSMMLKNLHTELSESFFIRSDVGPNTRMPWRLSRHVQAERSRTTLRTIGQKLQVNLTMICSNAKFDWIAR